MERVRKYVDVKAVLGTGIALFNICTAQSDPVYVTASYMATVSLRQRLCERYIYKEFWHE